MTLTDKDNNTQIVAKENDTLDVILTANPSTGFQWKTEDCSAAKLLRIQYDPSTSIGAPTTVRFRFQITSQGIVSLSYARPWEDPKPPAKLFHVQITLE